MPAAGPALIAAGLSRHRAGGLAAGCGACLAAAVAVPILAVTALMSAVLRGVAGAPAAVAAEPVAGAPISCGGLAVARGFGPPVHSGIDLDCPAGTPVRSITAGAIHRRSDYGGACVIDGTLRLGGYGTYAILDPDGGGDLHLYFGHLQGYAAADGEHVAAGQVIGYEGSTGCSSGPHLHFEVRHGASAVNPCPHLPADYPTAEWHAAGCPLHLRG